jgi:hypothetical protein
VLSTYRSIAKAADDRLAPRTAVTAKVSLENFIIALVVIIGIEGAKNKVAT